MDCRFHVDRYSSAHVYLRLREGETIDDIPEDVLNDCVQLVKANSIEASKKNNIDVVYTMWSNLKKTGDMEVGQIGFHKRKQVKKVRVESKDRDVIKRLNKTKEEDYPDLAELRVSRDREERAKEREAMRKQQKEEEEEIKRKRKEKEEKDYANIFDAEDYVSNKELGLSVEDYEDDFM
eukprot:TRINITY_DN392_c0_g3_i2.p1 TRINITY_DN392_c0_g3~~TRINITY_DN392_c0_g3_i2.p1  ORF type:complete len:179 (+),score=59.66 TRINITY_DN392_c0_g3_i2:576-1112(+)